MKNKKMDGVQIRKQFEADGMIQQIIGIQKKKTEPGHSAEGPRDPG